MSRSYRFRDLVQYSGLTTNEAKHLVQQNVIRPDQKTTRGSGHHAAYGFLDVFEGRIAKQIYLLLNASGDARVAQGLRVPIVAVGLALDVLRLQPQLNQLSGDDGWLAFLTPHTRKPGNSFFLCLGSPDRPRIRNRSALESWIATTPNLVASIVRLDTLLVDLEQQTQDHCTPEDCGRAWKRGANPRRSTNSRRRGLPTHV